MPNKQGDGSFIALTHINTPSKTSSLVFFISREKKKCMAIAHHRFSVTPFLSLVFAFFYSAGNKLTLHDVSSSNISTDTHIYVLSLHVKSRETRRNGVRFSQTEADFCRRFGLVETQYSVRNPKKPKERPPGGAVWSTNPHFFLGETQHTVVNCTKHRSKCF